MEASSSQSREKIPPAVRHRVLRRSHRIHRIRRSRPTRRRPRSPCPPSPRSRHRRRPCRGSPSAPGAAPAPDARRHRAPEKPNPNPESPAATTPLRTRSRRGPDPEPAPAPDPAPAAGSEGPTNNCPSTPTWLKAPLSASTTSAASIADGTIKAAVEAPSSWRLHALARLMERMVPAQSEPQAHPNRTGACLDLQLRGYDHARVTRSPTSILCSAFPSPARCAWR